MPRINNIGLDTDVTKDDKLLGSDSGGSTKSYTLKNISTFLKQTNAAGVAGQLTYKYDTSVGQASGHLDSPSVINLETASTRTIRISIYTYGNTSDTRADLIDALSLKDIIVVNVEDPNNFGVYNVTNIATSGDYKTLTLSVPIAAKGSFTNTKTYAIAAYGGGSGDLTAVQTTTSNQLTITNGTGPIPSLAIVTGAIANAGTGLATADQIHTFVTTQTDAIAADTSGTAAKVTVTDSSTNTDFPLVFHNNSNALLDDVSHFKYNPSSGSLLLPSANFDGVFFVGTVSADPVIRSTSNDQDIYIQTQTGGSIVNNLIISPTSISGTAIKDEDNMSSNSATHLATQQSIKAYVDSQVDTVDTLSEILAIGNNTGGTKIEVNNTSGGIDFIDNAKLRLGTGDDNLEIYQDGTNSFIQVRQPLVNTTAGTLYINAPIVDLGLDPDTTESGDVRLRNVSVFTGSIIKDEDNMASNSASHLATQQSIKAYVDSQILTKDNTDEITEGSSNLYFTNERVDDRVNSLLTAGSNITLTYDDAGNALTIAATQLTNEQVQDVIGSMLGGDETGGIAVTYDDANNHIDFALSSIPNSSLTNSSVTINSNSLALGGTLTLDTGDIGEGSNLYFTNARADARITAALIDEDNMSSNSATRLPSQQSVKAYVDTRILTEDTIAELNDTTIGTLANAHLLIYDNDSSVWENKALSGDATITKDGVITVATLNQNTTGSAATVTGAAQSNITSLGTLTTLTVDNVIINGTTIGHTSDSDLMTLANSSLTVKDHIYLPTTGGRYALGVAGSETYMTKASFGSSHEAIKFSCEGLDGSGNPNDSGTTALLMNPTTAQFPGEIEAASLDISGDADIDGTLETDALTIGGVTSVPFEAADHSKLDGIEASADVTDTANVTSAGALMDSEVTDLAGVKGVTISTLQVKPSEGAFANGDKTKLDGIEASATADQSNAEIRTAVEAASDSNVFTDADHTKLNAIEASADVTDTTNVTAAGALMDSELTDLAAVKAINQGLTTSSNVSFGNITTTGYLRGPASFTIDPAAHGDNTGTLVIAGNLQVDGTTTTINSTTVAIDDLNFSIATDAADSAAANGAGITIGGASATLLYTHATTSWDMNKPLNVTGNIGVSGTVDGVDIAARDAVLTSTTTTAGAALPKAGGTMTGDIILGDNVKLELGAASGGDLQIYHDGSNSHIINTTGDLTIDSQGDDLILKAADDALLYVQGTDIAIQAVGDGKVGLRYNNVEKLETTSTGVIITGNTYLSSGSFLHFDNGGSNDYAIRKQGTTLEFRTGGTYNFLSGNATFAGNITLASDNKVNFGASSYIEGVTSGSKLMLRSSDDMIFQPGSSTKVTFQANGKVGIGTASPANLLNLSQAAGANIRFDNSTTSRYFVIGEGVGTNDIFSFRGLSYRSTDTLSIDFANDRVGIGTISPAQQLHIVGSQVRLDTAGGGYYLYNTSGTFRGAFHDNGTTTNIFGDANGSTPAISIESNNSTFAGNITVSGSTNRSIILDYTSGSGTYTWASFKQSGTEQFRVFGSYADNYLSFYNDQSDTHQLKLNSDGSTTFGGDVSLSTANADTILTIANTASGGSTWKVHSASSSSSAAVSSGDFLIRNGSTNVLRLGTNTNATFAGGISVYGNSTIGDNFADAHTINGSTTIRSTNTSTVAVLDVTRGDANNEGANATDFRFVAANRAITTERANMEIYTNNAQAADLGGSIGFGGRHTDSSTNDSLFATIKSGKVNATSANYAGYLSFGTAKADSDIVERMRIDYDGKVGIGIATPTAANLEVKSTQDASFDEGIGVIRSNSSQTGYINMVGGAMNINAPNAIPIKFRDGGATNLTIGGDGNATFAGTIGSGAITSTGNVTASRLFSGDGGNKTNPMIANGTDEDTGIFFPAANTMAFTAGDTEAFRIAGANATFAGNINATKASGDHKINASSGEARFTIETASGNGNNVYLALKSPDTEWRWITNRGDLNGGNQGDLFLRENTQGVNALSFQTNTGNATFAGIVETDKIFVAKGQNVSHATSAIKISQELAQTSQIRFYGADTSTAGSLDFTGSSSDGSVGGVRLTINADGSSTFAGTVKTPTLIIDDYGNSTGSDADGWRLNSTSLYGQTDGVDKVTISSVTGNVTFAGNLTVQGATTRLENNVTVGNSSADYLETRYNDTANYATRLMWRGLQFGNNGVAKIVAGRTAANGFFEFYVNNTNDGLSNTPDGLLALTIAANKNATFAGDVLLGSSKGLYTNVVQAVSSAGLKLGNDDNSQYIFIKDDTGVGIGTTTPAEKLTVNGNMQLGNAGGGGYLKYNTGNLYIQGTSNIVATFESTGNVGIGTTNPERKLSLYQGDSGSSYAQFINTTTGSNAGDGLLVGIESDERAMFWNYENTDMVFATNNDTKLTIAAGGNATFTGDVISPGIYVGSRNASFDFYNNGTTYLNGATTVDAAFTQTGGAASTFSGNVTVTGDLSVTGTTTTVNQTNLDVSDNIIGLNRGATSNANDSGIIIERGSTGNNAAIIWDESNDRFVLGLTTATPSSTGSVAIASTSNLAANALDVNTISGAATTLTSTTSPILILNPTANNYGGVQFNYGGAVKGAAMYNSGFMVFGGESGTDTRIQAGGQYAMHINDSTRNIHIGGTTDATYKLQVNGSLYAAGNTVLAGTLTVQANANAINLTCADGNVFLNVNHTGNESWHFKAESASGSTDYVSIGASGGGKVKIYEGGAFEHEGLSMSTGTDVDQVQEFSMTFQLAANTWTDTGIDGTDLATGTYIMQVLVDDYGANGQHYDEYYSATISWFGTATNSTAVDEIIVHRAGHAPQAGDVQFRTQRAVSSDSHDLMLQVKHNLAYNAALDGSTSKKMIFKFRRLI